jgi:hypothetical protein
MMMSNVFHLISFTLVLSLSMCTPKYSPAHVGDTLVDRSLRVTQYDYGYTSNYLDYVFFQNGYQKITNKFETIGPGDGTCRAFFLVPSGGKREITCSHRCFENTDGIIKQMEINFTRSDLEKYIATHPPLFTIEGLRVWLKENSNVSIR